MLRTIFLLLLLAGAAGFGVYWWLSAPPQRWSQTVAAGAPDAANGETIFNIGGCSSCHAVPDQPDRLKLGGGLATPSPFGTFYAPNISPDANDGIGRWSEGDFVNAVRRGVSPGGTHYFPAFPSTSYAHAPVQDVRDFFASLKSFTKCPARSAITICRSRSTSAAMSASGSSCSSTTACSCPTSRAPRCGIAARI